MGKLLPIYYVQIGEEKNQNSTKGVNGIDKEMERKTWE